MAKAPKPFQPVIATANALRTGDVLFRTSAGLWARDVTKAHVADTQEAAAHLQAAADADSAACLVVDQALIPVTREAGVIQPSALRERIRAKGPTMALPQDGVLAAAGAHASIRDLRTVAQDI